MSARYRHIFILTGAGISAESGVKTFRDNNGLWENYPIEQVATPQAFRDNPELVHRFYNLRRDQLKEVKPNPAHFALAKLQNEYQGKVTLITQNVDDLHERGGSIEVIHMHGQLKQIRCQSCRKVFDWSDDISTQVACSSCHKKGGLRPNIVWFGEIPMFMEQIEQALSDCDLFLCIGTSGVVYPAAGFVQVARSAGAYCIECNKESTAISGLFERSIQGTATQVVPTLVEEILLDIQKLTQ